ncbi:MAG: hypothetical protein AAFN41_04675 [Planctomycetota bacterium]
MFRSFGTWLAMGAAGVTAAQSPQPDPLLPTRQADLFADAERRSLLQANQSGHDGRFFIQSADGTKRLNVGGYSQIRFYANIVDDTPTQDTFESGFQIERTRLVFSGQVANGTTFLILPSAGRNGTFGLLDVWIKQDLSEVIGEGWSITGGQFKLPFWREWLVSERFIQPVERSTLAIDFASIYGQGVKLSYLSGQTLFEIAYSDGLRSLNSDFAPAGPLSADTESEAGAVTVRLETALFGNKNDFSDMTSLGTEEPGLLIGAATHWQGETRSFFGTAVNNLTQGTVDISYEAPGYNLFGAAVIRHIEFPGGGDEIDLGALAQAGIFVSDNVEAFGRYTVLVPDSDAPGDDPFHELLAGATWFVAGHAVKVTGDMQYFFQSPNDTTVVGFGPNTGTGLLNSDGGQLSARLQLQFVF